MLAASALLAAARALGWTRLAPARLLGCLFLSEPRGLTNLTLGLALEFGLGTLAFPALYAFVFHLSARADVRTGAMLGLVHGLATAFSLPLIARSGRCGRRGVMAPAGLLGWGLGPATPVLLLLAHTVYGALLGYVYAGPGL
ncbi:MAG: hypothetical protein HY561_02705 [Gemmatimonadetes bacterium]|nr:hypothetical protein [Gemmatimonadota bacterium]